MYWYNYIKLGWANGLTTSTLRNNSRGRGYRSTKKVYNNRLKGTQMSESNNLDIDRALEHLAELLASKLEAKREANLELAERVSDLEDKLSDENFSEDDIRDWISDGINNATITIES